MEFSDIDFALLLEECTAEQADVIREIFGI